MYSSEHSCHARRELTQRCLHRLSLVQPVRDEKVFGAAIAVSRTHLRLQYQECGEPLSNCVQMFRARAPPVVIKMRLARKQKWTMTYDRQNMVPRWNGPQTDVGRFGGGSCGSGEHKVMKKLHSVSWPSDIRTSKPKG